MKLKELFLYQDILKKAYELNVPSGSTAFKLRSAIKVLQDEWTLFNETRDSLIKATGKNELGPNDPEYQDVLKKIEEALEVEIGITYDPPLTIQDLEGSKLSVKDIDGLIALKLLQE
jgi:hypothetical protein